ncbi:phage head completion protein [Sphingomonas hankookensis]
MSGIDPGELDRRVAILRGASVDDGTATVTGPLAEIGRRWAKRTDVSDGERMRAGQQGQSLTARFVMHADSLTKAITGKDVLEVVSTGERFEVVGNKEYKGRWAAREISTAAMPGMTDAA